mmetsp:Transcript_568/g.729  ORF Transcript_568/g.729 Transcript_568/m.729 type:complete len:116 (+) Transcript_568:1096-1443(+)
MSGNMSRATTYSQTSWGLLFNNVSSIICRNMFFNLGVIIVMFIGCVCNVFARGLALVLVDLQWYCEFRSACVIWRSAGRVAAHFNLCVMGLFLSFSFGNGVYFCTVGSVLGQFGG